MNLRAEVEEKTAVALAAMRELRKMAEQVPDAQRGDMQIDLVAADRAVKRASVALLAALERKAAAS